jgi:hypothetical protein
MLIELLEDEITSFDSVVEDCIEIDSDTLYDEVTALKKQGCIVRNIAIIAGRRLQGLHLHKDLENDLCKFQEFDDRVQSVNEICCDQGVTGLIDACDANSASHGVPDICSIQCALEYLPFFTDCSTMLQRVLDDEMPFFQALYDKCEHPNSREILYAISNADCNGGWETILEDVAYTGVSSSDEVQFTNTGSYSRIAVRRKSGYVSCGLQ